MTLHDSMSGLLGSKTRSLMAIIVKVRKASSLRTVWAVPVGTRTASVRPPVPAKLRDEATAAASGRRQCREKWTSVGGKRKTSRLSSW
jgi:hypothetical protein